MKLTRYSARLAALAAAVVVIVSCDTRRITGAGLGVDSGNLPAVTALLVDSGRPVTLAKDSILVSAHLHDDAGLARVTFEGFSQRGDSALGTSHKDVRYSAVTVPGSGAFPLTTDTTIYRYLQLVHPVDSTADSLIVSATVTGTSGRSFTRQVKLLLSTGPSSSILSRDSLTKSVPVTIVMTASSAVGISTMGYTVRDSAGALIVNPPYARVFSPVHAAGSVTDTSSFVPPDLKGALKLTPYAIDATGNRTDGASVTFAYRQGAAPAPVVRQVIPARAETVDTLTITATGSGIKTVGYKVRTRDTKATVDSNSVAAIPGPQKLQFRVPDSLRGRTLEVISFAVDMAGLKGYSIASNITAPQTTEAGALADTMAVVYGRSFSLPHPGVAGDLTVDSARSTVFVSNTSYNRLERWTASNTSFDPVGVAVGSLPWGMVLQTDNDTLLVANSGGTNISKVCVNAATCGSVGEVLSQRIQTRNTVVQSVSVSRDAAGKITLSLSAPISYSDRPQYVQQSAGGRVFYSTRPTTAAPAGTIRWLDPKLPVPDPRQVYQYAETTPGNTYAVFNADSLLRIYYPNNPGKSDELIIFDHVYGQKTGGSCTAPQTNGTVVTVANTVCGRDSVVSDAVAKVNAQGGDVDARLDIDIARLGLTDTTFVASSGDRTWVGFGEGAGGRGRVMMVQDLAGDSIPRFFSPGMSVNDLIENASETVMGMSLDQHGSTVAVHGAQSYFATVESPFHMRLQGKYDTFDRGAGIVFHPSADLRSTAVSSSKSDMTRTAFVASANGTIEIVDAAYFISRGTLQVKGTLYGPLRASLPFKTDNVGIPLGDPRRVVLKLFGLTSTGLVVIDLRAQDITPVP